MMLFSDTGYVDPVPRLTLKHGELHAVDPLAGPLMLMLEAELRGIFGSSSVPKGVSLVYARRGATALLRPARDLRGKLVFRVKAESRPA